MDKLVRMLSIGLCALPLAAQSINGSIVGTVRDPQQGLIAGASITAENIATGRLMRVVTDQTGDYSAFPLVPGRYRVHAEASGFQSKTVSDVVVDLDSRVRVDFALALGTVQDAVTVESTAGAFLQTDSSVVESVVENKQIIDLPLNGRNINQLVFLTPGTAENFANQGLGDFSADGNRPWGNTFFIDGIANRDEARGQSGFGLSLDAVQEFKVKKSNATAEFGGGGSTVALAVKSGTNQFHGSAYEYNRSKLGEARSFFNPSNELPPFLRNQFGASLGGPIRRNRTFFFANYEGSRVTSSESVLCSVPTAEMRAGDFRGVLDTAGKPLTLRVPQPLPFTLSPGRPLFTQPNVINPFYLADSASNPNRANVRIAKAVLEYLALPTLPGQASNYSASPTNRPDKDQITAKLDHRLNDAHTISLRTTLAPSTSTISNDVSPSLGATSAPFDTNSLASLTSIIRPTLINEFRFGWQQHRQESAPTPPRNLVKEFGIPEPIPLPDEKAKLNRIPVFSFMGNGRFNRVQYTNVTPYAAVGGDSVPALNMTTTANVAETLTWQKNRHEIKAGFQLRRLYYDTSTVAAPRGAIAFNGRANALSSGYSIADFLLGLPATTQFQLFPHTSEMSIWEHAAFLQDDWRVSDRLTLNLGVRWEVRHPATEPGAQLSSFDLALGKIVVASPGGKTSNRAYPLLLDKFANLIETATQAGWNENGLLNTDWNDWAPRVGFALRLDSAGRTVARGSYGIFYSFAPYLQLSSLATQVPFSLTSQVSTKATDLLTNQNPFRALVSGKPVMQSVSPNLRDTYNQQWNFTLERAIFRESLVSAAYVGNRGVHLFGRTNSNTGSGMFPAFGDIMLMNSESNSIYHSLQMEFRRRYSRGLFYQLNWTWAKALDDVSLATGTTNVDVVSLNRRLNRADSDFTRRHVIRGNAVYDLPFGRRGKIGNSWPAAVDALLGGWSLGSIVSFTTGQFATPGVTGGIYEGRPDRVQGVPISLSDADRTRLAAETGDASYLDPTKRWFNPFAFQPVDVSAGRIGNAGRNVIVGPNFFNADAMLTKKFQLPGLPERVGMTLRIETFNIFNHTNFAVRQSLTTTINSVNVGSFTDAAGSPRQFQFALRIAF